VGPHAMTATHQLNPEAVNVPLDPSDHRMEEVRHHATPGYQNKPNAYNYKMPAHAIEYRLLLPDCASSTDAVLPATAP